MRRLIATSLAACIAFGSPQTALAADVQFAEDPEYGCLVTLDGQIAAGDTQAVLDAIRRASTDSRYADTIWYNDYGDGGPVDINLRTPLNLCLNSPGGSLTEAIELTRAVHGRLGTMIRPGARCESACALVFMAGSYDTGTDSGIQASRHMHVDGRLGFHAPSLTVPEGSYDAASVARAYQVSVAATELIFRNLVKFRFSPSLAAVMHGTPPEQMYHISTVREAARWRISVIGIDAPTQYSDSVIRTACANLYMSTLDRQTSDPNLWSSGLGPDIPVQRDGQSFSYQGFGMEAVGTCQGRFRDPSHEYNMAATLWGPARAVQDSVWAGAAFPDAEPPLLFSLMQNYMAYPGEAQLIALPRNGQTVTSQRSGTCYVYNKESQLIDQEPCTQSRTVQADGTLLALHEWPSGARTVVETAGGFARINGAAASRWYWPDPRPQGAGDTCPRSDASGNTFCFHPG